MAKQDKPEQNEQMEQYEPSGANGLAKLAPFGLVVSVLSLIYTAGYYFVRRTVDLNIQIGLGLIVIGVAFYVLADPDRARESFTGRQARYSSNALIMTLAFLGILVVLNTIVVQRPKTWDWTADQVNTLTDQTYAVLEKIQDPITVTAFFSTGNFGVQNAKDMLDQYVEASDGKISYEFIDPNRDPIAAQTAEITADGTIVFWSGQRKEPVTFVNEREFTGAILRLSSSEDRVVYFLTGHGEYEIDAFGDESYQTAVTVLESKGYTVETLNLLSEFSVPEDASAVVIARPLVPLQGNEVSVLSNYLQEGGALVVLLEPPVTLQDYENVGDPLVEYLADAWGIRLLNDIVIDTRDQTGVQIAAYQYGNHIVTQKMENVATIFPTVRSVSMGEDVEGITTQELIYTAPDSAWAETNIEGLLNNEPVDLDDNDISGPSIAALAENPILGGRVVVFGDSDFPSNLLFDVQRNGDMFINAVDWAAEEEGLIDLNPRTQTPRFLAMTPEQVSLIRLFSIFFLPGSMAGIGVWVYISRRRRT